MSDTFHLQKRGDVWHYYRRVPKHLVQGMGKRFIKRSLGVTSKAEAKRLRSIEDLKTDALFASLEKTASDVGASVTKLSEVSLDMLTEHLIKTVRDLDKKNANRFLSDPPEDNDVLHEMWQSASIELGVLQDLNNPQRDQWIGDAIKGIMAQMGVSTLNSETSAQFFELVRRGLVELQRRKIDRYSDNYTKIFHDNLFSPQSKPSVYFGEIAKIFLQEKQVEFEINGVSLKRFDKIKALAEIVVEIIGSQKVVSDIDDDVIQNVRVTLSKFPSNRKKRFGLLPIDQAIAKSEKEQGATLSS